MPIPSYRLDDRGFDDLVNELISRIPGHTPEWTNPSQGDPGRTLIELFAWLGDTLLYRANLIPERQRLEFLRLLNIPLRPARPARGLLALEPANPALAQAVQVPLDTLVPGPAEFETREEIMVLPVAGTVYAKRRLDDEEEISMSEVIGELESVYDLRRAEAYVTTPLFGDGKADPRGFDFAADAVDSSAWIALLAPAPEQVAAARAGLERDESGEKLLNIGLHPRLEVPDFDETERSNIDLRDSWEWEITSPRRRANGDPVYVTLELRRDTTDGYTQPGIVRLALPEGSDIGVPENDVDVDTFAGVGDRPPRIDEAEIADRLVAWVRMRPKFRVSTLAFSWLGINTTVISQQRTLKSVVVGRSDGNSDQRFQLPAGSVEAGSLRLEIEEPGAGYRPWTRVDDLAGAGRDDRAYQLDPEAGTVMLGDNVRGFVPPRGMRLRVARMQHGGGAVGNLPAGNLNAISHPGVKAKQPAATIGGANAETLEEAEKRIPAFLQHGDRAVTESDYQLLARETPTVSVARAEVLPRFKPQQRLDDVAGVVSLMVLPRSNARTPPNPRPDRVMLEQVHAFMERRRPLGVELYVIGPEYVPLSLAVAVTLREGHVRDATLQKVRDALRDYLWPLLPGGVDGAGWPLGRAVSDQELEVAVARVEGVRTVSGVNLFEAAGDEEWRLVTPDARTGQQKLMLQAWQLPELMKVLVIESEDGPPDDMDGSVQRPRGGTPIPVIPEVC
jgi:hypothetical protein